MKYGKIVILGLLVSTAFGGAFWLAYHKPTVAGEIEGIQRGNLGLKLEPQILDLGMVTMNRETNFAAMIHNYGQQPIELARVEKSCGCTSVSVAKLICQPGEDVELKGTLYPRKPGKFRHSVRVIEDNKSAPELILEVVGEVQASLRAYPETVLLNPSVFENKAIESVIIIGNNSEDRAVVRKPTGLPEGISVRITNGEVGPKQEAKVVVRKAVESVIIIGNNSEDRAVVRKPTALPEGISVRITNGEVGPKQEAKVVVRAEPCFFLETNLDLSFPTSHPRQDNVAVTVQLRPENGFTIEPNKIGLGVVSKKELEKSLVRLSLIGPGVKNVTINQILTPPFLKLVKESTRKGDRMELEFAFAKTLQGMSIQGLIRIDLDVSAQGSEQKRTIGMNVPISGLLRD